MKHRLIFPVLLLACLGTAFAQTDNPSGDASVAPNFNVPNVTAPTNGGATWQPTIDQRERVIRDVLVYLRAKDAGRFAEAYSLFTPEQKAAVPFAKWETDMQNVYAQAGTVEERALRLVTWYRNPPNVSSGIYAAVNFSSRFTGLSLHCGFVAMKQQPNGAFGVAREEENFISKSEMAKLSPEALEGIRAQFGC